jgi:hypothetical protein
MGTQKKVKITHHFATGNSRREGYKIQNTRSAGKNISSFGLPRLPRIASAGVLPSTVNVGPLFFRTCIIPLFSWAETHSPCFLFQTLIKKQGL